MTGRNWITPGRAVTVALCVLALGAALLLVHYARWDVVAKYPIDGVVTSCRPEGLICKTMELEVTADGTGKVVRLTLPAGGDEVGELARAPGTGSHVRVWYERRAIWIPWEGSTRRAVGVDWLPLDGGLPAVIGEHRPEPLESENVAREQAR